MQNYLSNVFRPIYTYDTTTALFTPKLELSNIDNYSGNTLSVFTIAVGDSRSNVYVGSNSGNVYTVPQNCSNNTALGYGAGSNISNVSNSVFIGTNAGANNQSATSVISIGANAGGIGSSNIFIGTSTKATGTSNIFIGHDISSSSIVSNQIRIGTAGKIPIAANSATNWVGLGGVTGPVFPGDGLDVSGSTYILGNVGINTMPGVNGTLDINGNFYCNDGYGFMDLRTDVSANTTVVTIERNPAAGGTSKLNVTGYTQSSTGFYSGQSNVDVPNVSNDAIIGPIKKGIINISAVDQSNSANRAASIYFAYSTSNITSMSAVSNGTVTINTNGTNLRLTTSNVAASTYDYSITYFPLP